MQDSHVQGPLEGAATTPGAAGQPRRWQELKTWLAWIAGGLLIGWTLAIIWWAVLDPNAKPAAQEDLIIPPRHRPGYRQRRRGVRARDVVASSRRPARRLQPR